MEQRRLWNRYISKRLTGLRLSRMRLGVLLAGDMNSANRAALTGLM
jgi:hypothetical protein